MSALYFPLGLMEGFTASKLADKKTGFAIPIRELMQNALDADAKKINIYIETINKHDIPHIEDYEQILAQAITTQHNKGSYRRQQEQIVKQIKRS